MVEVGDEAWFPGGEACAEVVEISGFDGGGEDLVDDGEEVVEAGDGREGLGVGGAEGAPGGGEEEGVLDGLEREGAALEGGGEPAVGGSDATAGAGGAPVEVEEALDVVRGGVGRHGLTGWPAPGWAAAGEAAGWVG